MIPRLRAKERLERIADHAVGTGSMNRRDAARHQKDLRKAAGGGGRGKAAKANPTTLASMGIGVVTVPSRDSSKADKRDLSDG